MTDWKAILDWELKEGSHPFPGPNGGTCVNEAAIVAAGFPYKRIRDWQDLPRCFSPVLGQVAILLNDSAASDETRQQLLPLVTSLAGSFISIETEVLHAEAFTGKMSIKMSIPELVHWTADNIYDKTQDRHFWQKCCALLISRLPQQPNPHVPVTTAVARLAAVKKPYLVTA